MSLAPSLPVASIQHAVPHIIRPSVNFPPNIWGDFFLQYHSESLVIYLYFILYMQFLTTLLHIVPLILFKNI